MMAGRKPWHRAARSPLRTGPSRQITVQPLRAPLRRAWLSRPAGPALRSHLRFESAWRPRRRCTPVMRPLIFLLALTGLLVACAKTDPAAGGTASKAAVRLLLAPEDLSTLQPGRQASGPVITGSIQPERRADLRAEVAAVVQQVLKDNGEPVHKGDLLVRLDDTALRSDLASAEEAARAATQAYDQAQRQVQRLTTLQQQGMISTQGLEDAEIRRNGAQNDLAAARARVVSARQQLQRTEVRAPFDGVVSDRKASAGDTAQIGKELLKVIDPGSMRFEGLVSADRMQALKVGQAVSFRVNGYASEGDFDGRVRRIDATADPTTRQVSVIVDFADPARAPRVAGLFAEGRVETGEAQALMVHDGSIVREGEQAFVWRIKGRVLAKTAVTLGARDARSGEVPVLEGLAAGDRILRHPGSNLVDGQAFDFAPVAASAAASAAR
jgi:membrane fusion protein, multidrug efflux system